MTIFSMSFDSEARRYTSARHCAGLATIIALAYGCNARLAVSDDSINGNDGTYVDAGAGGASGSHETLIDASTSPSSCQDGTLSGDESDMDCGGPSCPACAAQSSCAVHADCQSGSCRAGLCREPACDDGVKNGEETSVDCGGPSCRRCASKTCNCASSPDLLALECDETDGPIFAGGDPMISPDGEAAVFMLCHSEVYVSGTPICTTFRWTSSGTERLAPLGAYTMSRDGQGVLLQNDDGTMSLSRVGGDTTPLPLPFGALPSADGTKVVGIDVTESNSTELRRWSEAGGLVTLAELAAPGAASEWSVRAMTSDASTVVGYVETEAGYLPFRWTEGSGLGTLGPLPQDATGALPTAMSDDGAVVVGVTAGSAQNMVFRWTSEGFQTLAPWQTQYAATGSYVGASPSYVATSRDGSVVAATISYPDPGSFSAWRFSTTDGATLLSTESPAAVHDMTPDGTVFIGTEGPDSIKWVMQPAVADQARQFVAVRFSDALQSSGVDLTGWELGPPTSVSDDGRIIFGRGSCGGVPTIYRWVSAP
jgi:hypothetical protein